MKHRNGKQSASAQIFLRLRADPAHSRFEKWVPGSTPAAPAPEEKWWQS
ncbi:hypothetical protein [Cellulomonas sp. WB94]|nr:hypothetical protein [Cellulomonas sp. WB94]